MNGLRDACSNICKCMPSGPRNIAISFTHSLQKEAHVEGLVTEISTQAESISGYIASDDLTVIEVDYIVRVVDILVHDIPGRHHIAGEYREICRSEEHTSELQSRENLVCRLLLE